MAAKRNQAMNNTEPKACFGQLENDRHYLKTCRHYKDVAHGARILLLHDLNDFAKKRASDRWYRVWERDRIQGWIFKGMQFGRTSLSE